MKCVGWHTSVITVRMIIWAYFKHFFKESLFLLQKLEKLYFSILCSFFFSVQWFACILMPLKKKLFGWLWRHSCTAFFTLSSSANWRPLRVFLRGTNEWKSEGANHGLWAGFSRTCQYGFWMVLTVRCAIWECALTYNRTIPCDNLPLWFVEITGLSSFLSMLL